MNDFRILLLLKFMVTNTYQVTTVFIVVTIAKFSQIHMHNSSGNNDALMKIVYLLLIYFIYYILKYLLLHLTFNLSKTRTNI